MPTTIAPLADLTLDGESVVTVPLPPGFEPADTRGAPLLGAKEYENLAQPAIPVAGGTSTLDGTVVGPEGEPVPGAIVRLERFVGDQGGYLDVQADEDGVYVATGIFGGHYRIRAWRQPDIATLTPHVTFLDEDGRVTIDVPTQRRDGRRLSAAIDIPEPQVGVAVALQVLYVQEEVDENGIVRGRPLPDVEVAALPIGQIRIDSDNPARTDENGYAAFLLMCLTPAAHTIAVYAAGDQFAYELPACTPGTGEIPPPPGEDDEAEEGTQSDAPDDEGPVVTAPDAEFAVGEAFTTPYPGPVPAGIYLASGGSSCQTTYEVFDDGRWVLERTDGSVLRLDAVTRSFRPAPFTKSCRFVRFR